MPIALEKKAILRCCICDAATASETEKQRFYKGYLSICPCCTHVGSLGITLVSHDEYMKLKKICDNLPEEEY